MAKKGYSDLFANRFLWSVSEVIVDTEKVKKNSSVKKKKKKIVDIRKEKEWERIPVDALYTYFELPIYQGKK